MTVVDCFDVCCSAWLPANSIQTQRELSGPHTCDRAYANGYLHAQGIAPDDIRKLDLVAATTGGVP